MTLKITDCLFTSRSHNIECKREANRKSTIFSLIRYRVLGQRLQSFPRLAGFTLAFVRPLTYRMTTARLCHGAVTRALSKLCCNWHVLNSCQQYFRSARWLRRDWGRLCLCYMLVVVIIPAPTMSRTYIVYNLQPSLRAPVVPSASGLVRTRSRYYM